MPSGTFTFAVQCRSSWTSNPSTPGMSFAIEDGSFSTSQTTARRGRRPSTFTCAPPESVHSQSQQSPHPLVRVVAVGDDPALRSASWIAAQTAWMAAPPPSPIPFVPSEVNGDGLSM